MTSAISFALALATLPISISAQQPRRFDVISIRENRTAGAHPYSNFPLNPGPQYNNEGGLLVARDIPILQLLVFAYAHNMYQIQAMRQSLPFWARETGYDVQARAEGRPTKDEMREMVRSLLADRFGLKLHLETREEPVFQLVAVHPGKLGPDLQPAHPNEPPCAAYGPYANAPVPTIEGGLPAYCGAVLLLPNTTGGQIHLAGRQVPLSQLALAIGAFGEMFQRPVVDGTGLPGKYDVSLTFTPESSDPAHTGQTTDVPLSEALRKQLGLKLESGKASVEVPVLDRLEKPTGN